MERKKITIIGLGLLGGSMGLRLREKGHQVWGVEQDLEHAELALKLGLVEEIKALEDGIAQADIIIMAIPVNVIEKTLGKILEGISSQQVITDTGSTKIDICESIKSHPNRGRYVAGHPLAGTEFSGPKAAFSTLFEGKKNLICDADLSDKNALEVIKKLNAELGMTAQYMESEKHDKHLAYVSHLSHVSSFMLGLTVLDIEEDEARIFDLAGTGFGSTVRLAKSSPQTWAPIFNKNKTYLSDALGEYIEHLQSFKKYIDAGDTDGMLSAMTRANEIKRILQKREV